MPAASTVRRAAAALLVLAAVLLPARARAAVPSVFLVQTSGWMEPFFTDPASPFKPLLKALVDASNTGRTVVAGFNQDGQVPGRRSPEVVFDDAYSAGTVGAAIDRLALAVRPGGRLADADFEGALVRSLEGILANRPGIVWLVTNNKNSRNNDPRIEANTRRFAELIRNSAALPLAVAYPVRMPVTGRQYTERGLIIYAFAYGDEAAIELARVVARPAMRGLFTDPPFKLKHLDEAPLTFIVSGGQPPVGAATAPDGTVVLTGVPASGGTPLRVNGTFRSGYYPQTINSADVSLAWKRLDGVERPELIPLAVEPPTLTRLPSGGQEPGVTLLLDVPPTRRPPGIEGLLAQQAVLNGVLEVRLSRLQLALSDQFVARMNEVAALDQLPDVFSDYQRVTQATALLPVALVVRFSPLPLIGAIGLAALLALLLGGGALLLTRARRYVIPVEGRNRVVSLRPFQSETVQLRDGGAMRVAGRLFGRPRVELTKPGAKAKG